MYIHVAFIIVYDRPPQKNTIHLMDLHPKLPPQATYRAVLQLIRHVTFVCLTLTFDLDGVVPAGCRRLNSSWRLRLVVGLRAGNLWHFYWAPSTIDIGVGLKARWLPIAQPHLYHYPLLGPYFHSIQYPSLHVHFSGLVRTPVKTHRESFNRYEGMGRPATQVKWSRL